MMGSRKRLYRTALVVAMIAVVAFPHASVSCFATPTARTGDHSSSLARYASGGVTERRDEPRPASEPLCCASATKSIAAIPSRPAASRTWMAIPISFQFVTGNLSSIVVRLSNRPQVHDPPAYLQHERLLI